MERTLPANRTDGPLDFLDRAGLGGDQHVVPVRAGGVLRARQDAPSRARAGGPRGRGGRRVGDLVAAAGRDQPGRRPRALRLLRLRRLLPAPVPAARVAAAAAARAASGVRRADRRPRSGRRPAQCDRPGAQPGRRTDGRCRRGPALGDGVLAPARLARPADPPGLRDAPGGAGRGRAPADRHRPRLGAGHGVPNDGLPGADDGPDHGSVPGPAPAADGPRLRLPVRGAAPHGRGPIRRP